MTNEKEALATQAVIDWCMVGYDPYCTDNEWDYDEALTVSDAQDMIRENINPSTYSARINKEIMSIFNEYCHFCNDSIGDIVLYDLKQNIIKIIEKGDSNEN